jgi:hypothetical protein
LKSEGICKPEDESAILKSATSGKLEVLEKKASGQCVKTTCAASVKMMRGLQSPYVMDDDRLVCSCDLFLRSCSLDL